MFPVDVCRICEEQSNLIDLSINPNYIEPYLIFGNVSYDINDGLPQFLCEFCITQLLDAAQLKRKCEETYKKFQDLLQMHTTVNVKIESNENYDNQNEYWYYVNNAENSALSENAESQTMRSTDVNLQSQNEFNNYDDVDDKNGLLTVLSYETTETNFVNANNPMTNKMLKKPVKKPKPAENLQLICDICKTKNAKLYGSMQKLELHMCKFHEMAKNLRQCEKCGLNSKWFKFGKLHAHNIKLHTKLLDYGQSCSQNQIPMQTIEGTLVEKKHKCQYCDKSFVKRDTLIKHTRMHTGEKPFKCEYCDTYFSQKHTLVRHTRTHTGEKPYKCEYCNTCYSHKSSLVEHTRTHTGEKPYNCEYCNKCFPRKQTLVDHTRKHTGEKPFKCEQCDNCFSRKKALFEHSKIHLSIPCNSDIVKIEEVETYVHMGT